MATQRTHKCFVCDEERPESQLRLVDIAQGVNFTVPEGHPDRLFSGLMYECAPGVGCSSDFN